jgi:hypothetical protein
MSSEFERELEQRFTTALYNIGWAPTKKISDTLGIRVNYINRIAKILEEKNDIVRLRMPGKKHKYDFFDELFPRRGYLIIDLAALDKFVEVLIDYMPERITPPILKDLKNQVEEIKHNGLPDQFYQRVRKHVDNLEVVGTQSGNNYDPEGIGSSIYIRKRYEKKKLEPHTININGLEIRLMPSGDVWLSERGRIRRVSIGPLREDDGIGRLYHAMEKTGYNLPPFEKFDKGLSKLLEMG